MPKEKESITSFSQQASYMKYLAKEEKDIIPVMSSLNYTNQLREHLKNMHISEEYDAGNHNMQGNVRQSIQSQNHPLSSDNKYLSEENSFDEKVKKELKEEKKQESPIVIKSVKRKKEKQRERENSLNSKIKRQNSESNKGSL